MILRVADGMRMWLGTALLIAALGIDVNYLVFGVDHQVAMLAAAQARVEAKLDAIINPVTIACDGDAEHDAALMKFAGNQLRERPFPMLILSGAKCAADVELDGVHGARVFMDFGGDETK